MGTALSAEDNEAIGRAVRAAETRTGAELAAVIVAASGNYGAYVSFDAFFLSAAITLALWSCGAVRNFPALLGIQLAVIAGAVMVPWLRLLFIRLLPRHVRRACAAKNAGIEYLHLAHHVSGNRPVVLLYISLAERYVHILHSRDVRETIPASVWNDIVNRLTAAVPSQGLKQAALQAIEDITAALARYYPPGAGPRA